MSAFLERHGTANIAELSPNTLLATAATDLHIRANNRRRAQERRGGYIPYAFDRRDVVAATGALDLLARAKARADRWCNGDDDEVPKKRSVRIIYIYNYEALCEALA